MKNVSKLVLFLLMSSSPLFLLAQGPPSGMGGGKPPANEPGYGKISGTVLDDQDSPVPYATVSIIDQKTKKVVDGTVAEDNGEFVIKSVKEGSYMVQIAFIGYNTMDLGPYEVTGKGESHNLGNIKIQSATMELNEVVVEGQRDLIEDQIDRIVYNAEQDKTTQGGDATDVLRRVPLLSVDLDGNPSLRGSNNVKVLIDGRPSTITAGSISDALKQIPADEIKSVEVITAPSARYDAEGTGGIINIITKKNNLEGGTLSVNSGIGLRSSMMHLNAGYRKRKMGYSLGGFGRAGYNIKGEYQNEQSVKDDLGSVISNTLQKAESSTNMMMGRYKFGWDYTPNKYNWLGSTVNFGLFNFKMAQFDRLSQKTIAAMTESSVDDVSMDNLSNTVDASLNYIRTFEEKGKEISLLSLYSQNARTNDFSIENLSSDVPALYEATLNENKSFNREMTIQLDYVEPVGEKVKLETGLKNIMRIVTSDYQYMVRPTGGTFTVLDGVNFNDVLDYRQNVAAGYFSGMFELPKGFGIQAGGRYEYTSIEADLQNEGGLDIPDYGIFVPSINLSKKIGQGKTLKFSFSQRIQRPSLQFLNPSRDASNPLNISQGNPLLQPEYNNNYEASFNTFSKGSAISVTGFARNTNGAIQRVREPIGQDTILTTYRNIGDEDAYGASIFGNLNKGKLSLGGGVDGYYAILNNNIDDPKYRGYNEGFVISGRVFGSYKLTELWAFQLFSFFRGNQIQLQGYQTSFYIYSLSLNRSFKDKKGSIGFGAENFLNQYMRMVTKVYSPSVDQFNTNLMRTLNFKINLSYRIGKLNMAQDRRRNKSINNDDLKDGGDSQGGGMMQN